jgi:predicted AAA+ superfamily ATPase
MKRAALKFLSKWKNSASRKPLLIRGARQVGKSFLVRQFAKEFEHFIEINFEKDSHAKILFQGDLAADELIQKINTYTEQKIIPGKTLLFLDEIQECEEAITALRYFKEEASDLHVIATGSLVDFKLKKMGLPVGRVQFLYVYPLSFEEYCTAINRVQLYEAAQKEIKLDSPLHEMLLEEIKRYCYLGGMPAVINTWIEQQDYAACQAAQDDILLAYRQDFNKYAKDFQIPYVDKMFYQASFQLGQKFKYATVDSSLRAANLREALELLETAGIVYRVCHSSAQGFPLAAGIDDRRFKVYFFDIGLTQRLLGMSMKEWLLKSVSISHLGSITEQFVLQEYVAYSSEHKPPELFYWHREAQRSNAEVDFLFVKDGNKITPVEVKAGSKGRLKSLKSFLDSHSDIRYGLKISESNEPDWENIQAIPFYAIQAWLKREEEHV